MYHALYDLIYALCLNVPHECEYIKCDILQKILFNIKVTKIMICFVKLFLMYHQYFCHIQMCISFARLYYSNTPDLREKAETLSPS